jgi:hypothetical protein
MKYHSSKKNPMQHALHTLYMLLKNSFGPLPCAFQFSILQWSLASMDEEAFWGQKEPCTCPFEPLRHEMSSRVSVFIDIPPVVVAVSNV